jgi:lipopolysaccharide transport system permease protein
MLTVLRRFTVLVAFKALAELRSERQRTYLGFLWWFFEPTFFMLVFYLVFEVFMRRGGPDFVPSMLTGLILWQWFANAVMHSTTAIQSAMSLLRNTRVPVAVFPLATLVADSVKFAFVFVVLILLLTALGDPPTVAYAALPLVLLTEFILTCGVCFLVAGVVPFLPDLRFVISPLLQGMFFLSGIFYTMDSVSPGMRRWLESNPMAVIIDVGRQIMLHGRIPDAGRLATMFCVGLAILLLGAYMVTALSHRYPKLAD